MKMRIESGIPGLDPLIQGGFLPNSVNLITGETGTGKTLFCAQYLWYGLQKGDTCLYISLEEDPEDVKADALQFGWDFEKFEKKGLFKIIYHDPAQVNNLGSVIIDEIKRMNVKRLAIDSTSIIGLTIESQSQIRKLLYNIIGTIKRTECTAFLTSEIPEGTKQLTRFGVEEFVVDSVIVLNYLEYAAGGGLDRSLIIRKMRRTKHGKEVYPMDITPKGIVIKKVNE
jgi:KaiC/GvpD/RAD55 family RecA-like ATPase